MRIFVLQLDEFQSLLLSTRVHTINVSYKFQPDLLNLKYNFDLAVLVPPVLMGPMTEANYFLTCGYYTFFTNNL